MNLQLQKFFSRFYNIETPKDRETGASSRDGTQKLRDELPLVFARHSIKKMFDAGCNDCTWSRYLDFDSIKYSGGDISLSMISHVWNTVPDLDVIVHDATTDPIPAVDVMFVRDVTLHLSNQDRQRLLQNWVTSAVPWLMITHSENVKENLNNSYDAGFPVSEVNWCLSPWNFPEPVDRIFEFDSNQGRCMALWHRDQIKDLI